MRQRLSLTRLEPLRESAIVDEIASQLDDAYTAAIAAGDTPAEAEATIDRHIADWEALASELLVVERRHAPVRVLDRQIERLETASTTRLRPAAWVGALMRDLLYGVRSLLKSPGFTCFAVAILALGIGANSLIFSVINTVMLRPLPYEDPNTIVRIWEHNIQKGYPRFPVSVPNFFDWREQNEVFEDLAAFYATDVTLSGLDQAEQQTAAFVSPSLFKLLRVEAALGRTFVATEEHPGRDDVAVMSHRLWQRTFGADPAATEITLRLDDKSHAVTGVMPPDFAFPSEDVDLWLPLVIDLANGPHRGRHFVETLGRLRPGVSIAQAQVDVDTIASRLEDAYPESNAGYCATVTPLYESMGASVRPALWMLVGTVALILLIACCNVANLLLVRAVGRERQCAVRLALGAGRWRLVEQALLEGFLLAIAGGATGLLLASFGIEALRAFGPDDIPRLADIRLDSQVVIFTCLVSGLTPAIFSLVPALRSSRPDLNGALKDGYQRVAGWSGRRLGAALVVVEVALVVILVTAAGLLARSFWRLQTIDPGFHSKHVLLSRISLPASDYGDPQQAVAFFQRLTEELRAVPGVRAVATTNVQPLGQRIYRFSIEGRPAASPGEEPNALYQIVSPDYLGMLGIPLVRGRSVGDRDVLGEPLALVINETMARQFFSNEDPIGQRINFVFRSEPVWQEIVGVVGDVRQARLDQEAHAGIYGAHYQWGSRAVSLLVQTETDPLGLVPVIRRTLRTLNPDVPIYGIETLDRRLADSIAARRFNAWLVSLFAALALILGAVGIYGVVASFVSQRTRDIGLRMALGARQWDVVTWVLKQVAAMTLAGIALGLAVASALTGVLDSLLFAVGPRDPLTFAVVGFVMLSLALLAGSLPARRASRVDPKETLICH